MKHDALATVSDVKNDLTLSQVGKLFAASGFFSDAKQEAQAITKILAGAENGFGPFSSMSGIHIIKGKMEMGADLLATAIKRSGKYTYKVKEMSQEKCIIEFFERSDFTGGEWQSIGVSEFSIEDAKKAGLVTGGSGWEKYARNMLFARALTNGQAWYCPDVFQSRIYSEGEISGAQPQTTETVVAELAEPEEPVDPHEEDLFAAYDAIRNLFREHDVNQFEASASIKKHLGVKHLEECTDLAAMRKYYVEKREQLRERAAIATESEAA
jgi:hypothetical protein